MLIFLRVSVMDVNAVILTLLLSMLPTFEGRYAILVSITVLGMGALHAFLIASTAIVLLSLILGYFIYYIDYIIDWFRSSNNRLLKKISAFYDKYIVNTRKRAKPYIDRYGIPGLILFVAIPFPATGVWTGALAGYLLGMDRRKLIPCLIVGGLLSNTIILLSVLATYQVIS